MNPVPDQYNIFSRGQGLGVRHFQSLLLFFGTIYHAIVRFPWSTLNEEMNYRSFWEKKSKISIVIEGNIITHALGFMLSGFLTTKMNSKYILLVSVFSNTVLHYLYPALSRYPFADYLIYLDFALSGMFLPCVMSIMVRWISPMEMNYICPLIFSGAFFGRFLVYSLSVDLQKAGGESSVHFFFANCGLVWCLAYVALGSSGPESCWYISEKEKRHIVTSLQSKTEGSYRRSVPWRGILSCVPLYAVVLSLSCGNLALYNHMRFVQFAVALHFENIHSNTLLQIFFIVAFLVQIPVAWIVTFLLKRNIVSKKTLRYTLSAIGQWGAGICYLLLSNSHGLTDFIIFGVLSLSLNSVGFLGVLINFFDLSRNYVGLLFGFAFAFSQIGFILCSVISEHLINTIELELAWRAIFFTSAVFLFLGNFFFTTFGSVQIQKFDASVELDNKR